MYVYIMYKSEIGSNTRIHSTKKIKMAMLPRAGIDLNTVVTIICKFFKNLYKNINICSI